MAVPAANYSDTSEIGALVADAVRSIRDAREKVLRAHAVCDYARDDGAIGAYLASNLGCPEGPEGVTEATKVYDELSSLKGYVESTAGNTFGAAVLQACAKLGV